MNIWHYYILLIMIGIFGLGVIYLIKRISDSLKSLEIYFFDHFSRKYPDWNEYVCDECYEKEMKNKIN